MKISFVIPCFNVEKYINRCLDSIESLGLDDYEIIVINDGSSIAEEDLERIFHPYEMGTNGKFGLGLSIVHKVCTTYGYHVDAENLPGEVCFRIWRNAKKGRRRTKHGRQG